MFRETSAAPGGKRWKMTLVPLTLVSPSVIPLTATMPYIRLRILQRDPPPFYLHQNIEYGKLYSGGLLI